MLERATFSVRLYSIFLRRKLHVVSWLSFSDPLLREIFKDSVLCAQEVGITDGIEVVCPVLT